MTMTPAEVRDHQFARASRFTRGYDSREVDAFVESVAQRLESGAGISSNDVYHQTFSKPPLADRGYAENGVNAFLDQVHAELVLLEDAWGHPTAAALDDDAAAAGSRAPVPATETPELNPDSDSDSDSDETVVERVEDDGEHTPR